MVERSGGEWEGKETAEDQESEAGKLDLVFAYLDDIEQQIERQIRTEHENVFIRIDRAKEILKGDMTLAARELQRLAEQGVDVNVGCAAYYFKEGSLYMAVATSGGHDTGDQAQWTQRAIEAFEKVVAIRPSAATYFNLGLCHQSLNQNTQALAAYQHAERLGDRQLSLKARKEIGRLELVSTPLTPASTSSAPGTGANTGSLITPGAPLTRNNVAHKPGEGPQWGWIIPGVLVCLAALQIPLLWIPGLMLLGLGIKGKAL